MRSAKGERVLGSIRARSLNRPVPFLSGRQRFDCRRKVGTMSGGPLPKRRIKHWRRPTIRLGKVPAANGKGLGDNRAQGLVERLQTVGLTEASNIQCMGMHGPVPLQEIFQPTKLIRQAPHISVARPDGGRVTARLSDKPVTPASFFRVETNAAIFAGPGWGKTTFLHHVLLRTIKSDRFVPVLITLRRSSAMGDLTRLVGMLLPLKKINRGMQILLLVDGYDEISTTSRKQVSEALIRFQAAGVGRYYLTCRDFYELIDLKIPTARIAPFDEEDQARFVQSYAMAFGSRIKPIEMLRELRERGMGTYSSTRCC